MPRISKPERIGVLEAADQPYSAAVRVGDHFHFSGIVSVTPTNKPSGDIGEQTAGVLMRMVTLLGACGLQVHDVYSATVMLAGSMAAYPLLNQRWNAMFGGCPIKPRRMVFAVASLPFGCDIEIAFDAVKQSD